MRTFVWMAFVSCALLGCLVGCEYAPSKGSAGTDSQRGDAPAAGTVAVIDLDAVARQLGRDKQIGGAIQQRQASLNEQLATVKASYEQEIAEKQRQIASLPSPEQSESLANIQRKAGTNLNEIRRRAQQNLNTHRLQLVNSFREEVRPFAQQVAREKGLSVIVTKNDSVVFDYDAAADITVEVAERMATSQPSAPAGS